MSAALTAPSEAPGANAPAGWYLGRESWAFHRMFFERLGRPAEEYEYSSIRWQIRRGAERIVSETSTGAGIYRVKAADDQMIFVRGGRQLLLGVMPADWVKPKAKLSLGKGTLAKGVLDQRLRRFGVIPTK